MKEKPTVRSVRSTRTDTWLILSTPCQGRSIAAEPTRIGDESDLEAAKIRNLQWLVSSPKFSQVVIDNVSSDIDALTLPDDFE
jgi:hypothetical protein